MKYIIFKGLHKSKKEVYDGCTNRRHKIHTGMYNEKKRPTGSELADNIFRDLDKKLIEKKKKENRPEIFPTYLFSEKSVLEHGKLQIYWQKRSTIMWSTGTFTHIAQEAKLERKNGRLF